MDDYTKVLVYGSFDGFAYSTDDQLAISVVLDNGEKVEIPEEFIVSADQMVNKYKIKLKDVIERIENFDLGTKAVWINEILNKLGSDYGLHKYYAGYKQGKFDGSMEREKVTVPQFVADLIEYAKIRDWDLEDVFLNIANELDTSEISEWFYTQGNMDVIARAWLDGYEVEQEKRYRFSLKNRQPLLKAYSGKALYFSQDIAIESYKVTRKELEEAGFGWVLDCEGIEIEEVEE